MPRYYFTASDLFTHLPHRLQKLVAKIEDHAELRIEAVITDQKRMACEFGKGKAIILVPESGVPRKASVFHELLHLGRYFVDGVPKLVYCDDEHEFEDEADARTQDRFGFLDNQIEHLFIVPRELARYRSERRYWEERMGNLLAAPERSDCDVLLAWEFVRRVLKGGVLLDAAQAQVDQRGLAGACDRLHHAIDESKEAATLYLFETVAPAYLPRACLDYFHQRHEIPLASWEVKVKREIAEE
ncbi:hypothetical protein [Cupriavidus sp. TMH.W2]|uniref:hypothetical protein n=1 Tax=Cupriavidus sp. TMH.W2 TaxID=3434465 RepID=UPI003D7877A1